MADAGRPEETGRKSDPEIGDAEWLFRDEGPAKPSRPAVPQAAEDSDEVFDLVDHEEEVGEDANPIPPPISAAPVQNRERTSSTTRETSRAADGPSSSRAPMVEPEDAVDVVWTRGAEWGPSLLVVGGCLAAVGILVYILMGMEMYSLAFLMLLLGLAAAAVLSYPILITLERPVRMTPEQAVRDFYGALSHHVPHYRRMWLLLARTGRTSSSYGSYEGFKSYWSEKIRTIKGDRAGSMTPLVFEVEDYRGDKSAGKTRVEIKFTLKISIRGQRQAGPVASIAGQVSLVRGPDRMWYLESGTLPQPARRS
ncbi:MAG: hypothetical protein ACYC61_32810 [Isosphaeraceae bacterium]